MGCVREAFIKDQSLVDVRKVVFWKKGRNVKIDVDSAGFNKGSLRMITD